MLPASGHFSPEQKETWEFYVAVYRAGLAAIHDGTRRIEVFEAMVREANRRRNELQSDLARKMAAVVTDPESGAGFWVLHSLGLRSGGEVEPEILRAGMIVTIEPTTRVPGQVQFNIEDVTLVSKDGYEILTPLPYDAAAIEQSMRQVRR